MKKSEIYLAAIDLWGGELQIKQAVQELLELALALQQLRSVDNIKKELVDAQIMIEQIRPIFFRSREEFYSLKWKTLRQITRRIKQESAPIRFTDAG